MKCTDDSGRCGSDPKSVEMDGGDVDVLCGEWQLGRAPKELSDEEYNVFLEVTEIRRHPNFNASVGPSEGNDIAVFKVNDDNLARSQGLDIHPICLPPNKRKQPTKGVHSGWSQPPPLYFLEAYGEGFAPFLRDFYKQWHYGMDIAVTCKDPTVSQLFGLNISFPSNSYYPPGTICATESTRAVCFSNGDSGSPLMATEENRPQRFYMEGVLSFVKGCDAFSIDTSDNYSYDYDDYDDTVFRLTQFSENPSVYTKLSCFLPWVAKQYGLKYDGDTSSDPSCSQANGERPTGKETCRETSVSQLTDRAEQECIFPFYYRDQLYTECSLIELSDFVYPVFRCPVKNSRTKREWQDPDTGEVKMVNDFKDIDPTQGHCVIQPPDDAPVDTLVSIDPEDDNNCSSFFQVPPFSVCKNDCPGGKEKNLCAT